MADAKSQMQLAIAAARAGKTVEAKILAKKVLEKEPENLNALLLMGTLSDSQTEQVNYFNQVLTIDPDHEIAKERLQQLEVPVAVEEPIKDEVTFEEPVALQAEEVPVTVVSERVDVPAQELPAEEMDEMWLDEIDEEPVNEFEQILEEEAPPTLVQPRIAETPSSFEEQMQAETIPAWLADEGGLEDMPVPAREESAVVSQPPEEQEIPDWLFAEPGEEWLEPELEEGDVPDKVELAVVETAETPEPQSEARTSPRVSTRGLEVLLILLIVLALIIVAALVVLIINPF